MLQWWLADGTDWPLLQSLTLRVFSMAARPPLHQKGIFQHLVLFIQSFEIVLLLKRRRSWFTSRQTHCRWQISFVNVMIQRVKVMIQNMKLWNLKKINCLQVPPTWRRGVKRTSFNFSINILIFRLHFSCCIVNTITNCAIYDLNH